MKRVKRKGITLPPRLIVVSGMSAAGKSTLTKGLAERITNGIALNRDSIMYGGLLCVDENTSFTPNLPSFREYVARDNVFPENVDTIETPFGPMTRVRHDPPSNFHGRHVRDQSYLVAIRLAEENIQLGKVPILDGYQMRHIDGGSLQRVMNLPAFASYPKYLIHVVVDMKECYQRLVIERGKNDPEALIRGQSYQEKKKFLEFIGEKQKPIPDGLKNFDHLVIDTTPPVTIEECLKKCLKYIQA